MELNQPLFTWELNAEDPRFLILKVDGAPWKEVYKCLYQRHLSNLKGTPILEEAFDRLEDKLCKAECYRLLALKGRLLKELQEKLSLKKFSKRAIEKAVEDCEKQGFINDQEEANRLALRLQKKGYGASLIAAKVRAKGGTFRKEAIEDPLPLIHQLLEKKYRGRPREKVIAALLRRGFDYATILDALNSQGFYKQGKGS